MNPMEQLMAAFSLLGLPFAKATWSSHPAVFLMFDTTEVVHDEEFDVARRLVFLFNEDGSFRGLYEESM